MQQQDSVKPGDYVLATKYSDGDPGDHWVVGFFSGMLPKSGGDRYMVTDEHGKQFRGNGFRRAEKISPVAGGYLLGRTLLIQSAGISLWQWRERAEGRV